MTDPELPKSDPDLGTSDDAFLGGKLAVLQLKRGFRAGVDSVLLAASLNAADGDRVLDVGTGGGVVALCAATRHPHTKFVGIELQKDLAELARQNVVRNSLSNIVEIQDGDILDQQTRLGLGMFDHVVSNPPFYTEGQSQKSPVASRALAHQGRKDLLEIWINASLGCLRPKGTLTIVHLADSLDEILIATQKGAGQAIIFPLWPKAGQAAKRVIVQVTKGSRSPTRILPGLTLHQSDGTFTHEAQAVLRHGGDLSFD